jgi:hypothetical protein
VSQHPLHSLDVGPHTDGETGCRVPQVVRGDGGERVVCGLTGASMTLDTYADLFDEDLDEVADRLDAAIKATADALRTEQIP